MDLIRCEHGHLYDPGKHSSCPFCGVPDLDIKKTRPRKLDDEQEAGGPKKTEGALRKKIGIDPVVGWLVCVKGPNRGQDYRIRGERNFIGRSEKMDICIAADNGISRDKHAVITYNPLKNGFKVSPGESNGLIYLNGDDVDTPSPLGALDRIRLGETELVFVPFCGEHFQWE